MIHSIIIPHRGREPYLRACLASIAASTPGNDRIEFEVIVAQGGEREDGGESIMVGGGVAAFFVVDTDHPEVFNKPRLLNRGIDAAHGDVLTFLDCDAIVGPQFLNGVESVDWSTTTRLCYRVRYLDRPTSDGVIAGSIDPAPLFAHYDRYQLAFEAYGTPEKNRIDPSKQPWGNSQFSMTRERLGDLRFDEAYCGRGFEDLSFSKALAIREGNNYHGVILTDPAHAMFHLTHDYEASWMQPQFTSANLARYKQT